jgi:hypothetical protein
MEAGRALDFLIAEHVFGVDPSDARIDPMIRNGEPQFHWGYPWGHDFAPNYSTDIGADHSVHQHVCDTWDKKQISAYFRSLWRILYYRWVSSDKSHSYDFDYEQLFPMALYEVGDYSRAALSAATGESK